MLSPLEKFARSYILDGLVLVSSNVSQAKVSFLIRVCQANMRYRVISNSYSIFNKYFLHAKIYLNKNLNTHTQKSGPAPACKGCMCHFAYDYVLRNLH
jgi:hypothetical protein